MFALCPARQLATRSLKIKPTALLYTSIRTKTMANFKPNTEPPKHEMVYFPHMNTTLPSTSHVFRKVLFTGLYSQVVLMTVPVGGDIGDEVHLVDQVLSFTSGKGKATIAGKDQDVNAGDLMVVPAGTQHQFVNTGDEPLILYTIYSPAEHKADTVHETKDEGEELEDAGKDEAPEWAGNSKEYNEKKGLAKESGKYD